MKNDTEKNDKAPSQSAVEGLVISAAAICGNCDKPYEQHHFEKCSNEDIVYCFTHTNEDIFTDTPVDGVILEMILSDNPGMYDEYLTKWRKINKHL